MARNFMDAMSFYRGAEAGAESYERSQDRQERARQRDLKESEWVDSMTRIADNRAIADLVAPTLNTRQLQARLNLDPATNARNLRESVVSTPEFQAQPARVQNAVLQQLMNQDLQNVQTLLKQGRNEESAALARELGLLEDISQTERTIATGGVTQTIEAIRTQFPDTQVSFNPESGTVDFMGLVGISQQDFMNALQANPGDLNSARNQMAGSLAAHQAARVQSSRQDLQASQTQVNAGFTLNEDGSWTSADGAYTIPAERARELGLDALERNVAPVVETPEVETPEADLDTPSIDPVIPAGLSAEVEAALAQGPVDDFDSPRFRSGVAVMDQIAELGATILPQITPEVASVFGATPSADPAPEALQEYMSKVRDAVEQTQSGVIQLGSAERNQLRSTLTQLRAINARAVIPDGMRHQEYINRTNQGAAAFRSVFDMPSSERSQLQRNILSGTPRNRKRALTAAKRDGDRIKLYLDDLIARSQVPYLNPDDRTQVLQHISTVAKTWNDYMQLLGEVNE